MKNFTEFKQEIDESTFFNLEVDTSKIKGGVDLMFMNYTN